MYEKNSNTMTQNPRTQTSQ